MNHCFEPEAPKRSLHLQCYDGFNEERTLMCSDALKPNIAVFWQQLFYFHSRRNSTTFMNSKLMFN